MAKHTWTDAQISAIEHSGSDILVSAAAGSGKTAVLTERIIKKLTDTKNNINITDFLIVTFTVSATSELREKLSVALRTAYRENKQSKKLKKQILNLPSAKILTIDSFCKFVVNECAKDLMIPVDFELGEENELKAISSQVLSNVIDSLFNGEEHETIFDTSYLPENVLKGFLGVVETFSSQKTFAPLFETISEIYNKMQTYPEPSLKRKDMLSIYDVVLRDHYVNNKKTSFFDTHFGLPIISEIREALKVCRNYFLKAREVISGFEEMEKKYLPAIEDDIKVVEILISAKDCELIKRISEYTAQRLGNFSPKSSAEIEAKNLFNNLRTTGKDIILDLAKKYPIWDEEELFFQLANSFSIANELFSIIDLFEKRLWNEKLERKVFSFGDVSHLAYKALIKEGTYNSKTREFEKTDYANELSEKFHEVLIDEYQDVNELQDTIFRAVSNSHNRFMVGDVKQSIYKFRGASPEIFMEYRKTFTPIKDAPEKEVPTLVSLQNNFRSDSSVIDFVNPLFEKIMNYRDRTVYTEEDFLVFSKNDDAKLPTELSVFDDKNELEYVADSIIDLVNEKKVFNFGDICVLARRHDSLKEIQKVLSKRLIPCDYTPTENFFTSYEIQTVVSLLKAVDNPSDDVAFVSLLTSPVFAFSADELMEVKQAVNKSSYYFAVDELSKTEGEEKLKRKCDYVIKKIKSWRLLSRTLPCDTLIWKIYDDTSLLTTIGKLNSPDTRRDNLISFYNIAKKFENGEYKGITKFLLYLDVLTLSSPRMTKKSADENCVKLLTIHDSKGLEFPVCYLIHTGVKFNRLDERKKVLISDTFGPTFAIPMGKFKGRVATYVRKAATSETRSSLVEEELRLLYVALTRAKKKLIVTGTGDLKKFVESFKISNLDNQTFSFNVKTANDLLKLISVGLCQSSCYTDAINSYNGENLQICDKNFEVNFFASYDEENKFNLVKEVSDDDKKVPLLALNKENVNFSLKSINNSLYTDTPFKISVSTLREGLLDEGVVDSISRPRKYPDFTSLQSENIASFTGTAMHVFMQFCDFENCEKNGTIQEAQRLYKYKFITEEQLNVLNHKTLTDFFSSGTYKNIKKALRVEREKRYTIKVPSSEFYSDEVKRSQLDEIGAKTLIQGVIDCYYVNPDNTVTIIDFKTDNVGKKDGEKVLRERHSKQLRLYKNAVEQIENMEVSKVLIYSFSLCKEIEI
ncbi:MAG: hypothetical protein E7582_02580 [Ruminococcaceae bacterium]|nr:hypothetical protein [Oscillospiraceae bacterium]